MNKTLYTLLLISIFIAAVFFGALYFIKKDLYQFADPSLMSQGSEYTPSTSNGDQGANQDTAYTKKPIIVSGIEKQIAEDPASPLNELPAVIAEYKKLGVATWGEKEWNTHNDSSTYWKYQIAQMQLASPELRCVITSTTTPLFAQNSIGKNSLPLTTGIKVRYSYCVDPSGTIVSGIIIGDTEHQGELRIDNGGGYQSYLMNNRVEESPYYKVWNLQGRTAESVLKASLTNQQSALASQHCVIKKEIRGTKTFWTITPDAYMETAIGEDPWWGACGDFGPQNYGFDVVEENGVLLLRIYGQDVNLSVDIGGIQAVKIK